ncbi:MAG: tRNA pseudouridine(55) synthase TruB [Erysipelotrichaceae bacterium]|nr:tRNA pseudouridine(55) synthase TruB [Erysipelotrichaceae bacterium]
MDGFLLVNKPQGITSHTLVLKVRRALGIDKIGHTGTLDPMATGLMLLSIGKATKVLPFVVAHDKQYIAELTLGKATDTLDITGEITEEREVPELTEERVKEVLDSFIGDQKQLPPMYSAKKVNGQTLYKAARNNQQIERKPQDINITELKLISFEENRIRFSVDCSSGTYIRVLAADIAGRLGTVGCLSYLDRTRIDRFKLKDAFTLEQIENGDYSCISIYEMLKDYPYYEMNDASAVLNGKTIRLECDEPLVMITHQNEVLAAYERLPNGYYHCRRGLW